MITAFSLRRVALAVIWPWASLGLYQHRHMLRGAAVLSWTRGHTKRESPEVMSADDITDWMI